MLYGGNLGCLRKHIPVLVASANCSGTIFRIVGSEGDIRRGPDRYLKFRPTPPQRRKLSIQCQIFVLAGTRKWEYRFLKIVSYL